MSGFNLFIPVVEIPNVDAWPLQRARTPLAPKEDPMPTSLGPLVWRDTQPTHFPSPSSPLKFLYRTAVPLLMG